MSSTRSAQAGSLHLTRRGRLLVVLTVAALVFAAFSFGRASSSTASAASGTGTVEVLVQPGDSLWTLAEQAVPDEDPREVVEQIRSLNGLTGELQAGQVVVVPAA